MGVRMRLYTAQLAQWRKVKEKGLIIYDITYKSGDRLFSPSGALLWDYKLGNITDEEYTSRYLAEMRVSYATNKKHWWSFLRMEDMCIACYCKADSFCHRYILVDILSKVAKLQGIEFEYKGEIK